MRMKKRFLSLLVVAFSMSFLSMTPSFAADNWPAAPAPQWPANYIFDDIRLGQWIPCKADWNSTNDCIQSLTWAKSDGSKKGESTFVPNPTFDPMIAKQIWESAKTPQGDTIDNYAHFDGIRAGTWTLPDGFVNSDGSNSVYVEAHVMMGGLQFRVITDSGANLPADSYVTITLKSTNYSKHAGWILSNTKNPTVDIKNDLVVISGTPVVTPFDSTADGSTCTLNTKKAAGAQSMIQISVDMQNGQAIKAGDAIIGTNGLQCFKGVGFDPNTHQLVVGVGQVHFNIDGSPVAGWFELQIKGSRAKQWWGIDPAVAVESVQVQVIYENGTSVIATTQAKYDKKNDWITLKSQGFHYSSPRLQISFGKAALKSTITCVKGKASKKVSGAKPACPAGYKKK